LDHIQIAGACNLIAMTSVLLTSPATQALLAQYAARLLARASLAAKNLALGFRADRVGSSQSRRPNQRVGAPGLPMSS